MSLFSRPASPRPLQSPSPRRRRLPGVAAASAVWHEPLESRVLLAAPEPRITLLAGMDLEGGVPFVYVGQSVHARAVNDDPALDTDENVDPPGVDVDNPEDVIQAQFQWDFGDPAGKYNDLPGFNAGHVYDRPGDYTISLTVTNRNADQDQSKTVSTPVRVKPWPAARTTIRVAPNGSPTGSGVAPEPPVNWARLQGALDAAGAADAADGQIAGVEVVLQHDPGDATLPITTAGAVTVRYDNVLIRSDDPADRVRLDVTTSGSVFSVNSGIRNTVVQDVWFDTAGVWPAPVQYDGVRTNGTNTVVRHCKFDDPDDAVLSELGRQKGLLLQENEVGIADEYFLYNTGDDVVVLGNTADKTPRDGSHNIRSTRYTNSSVTPKVEERPQRFLAYDNTFTNLRPGHQTLRVNHGDYFYWANNTLKSGSMVIGPQPHAGDLKDVNGNPEIGVRYVVVEANKALQTPLTTTSYEEALKVNDGSSFVMVRNNVFEQTRGMAILVLPYEAVPIRDATPQEPNPPTVPRFLNDLYILNNTVVNKSANNTDFPLFNGTTGKFIMVEEDGNVSGIATPAGEITLKNNLYVAPNLTGKDASNGTSETDGGNPDDGFSVVVRDGVSLSVFKEVFGNVWAKPAVAGNEENVAMVNGMVMKIDGDGVAEPNDWPYADRLIKSDADPVTYKPSTLDPAGLEGVPKAAGVYRDYYGVPRWAAPSWTAGAVQRNAATTIFRRRVFYNNSSYDGNNPAVQAIAGGLNNDDTDAIAPDKQALLPGQGAATPANYTNYDKGINGIMVDMVGLSGTPNYDDFILTTGSGSDPATYGPGPLPAAGAGQKLVLGGITVWRITFTYADNAIKNKWLRTEIKANLATGLAAPDVFYFGNLAGDTGDSQTTFLVNVRDEADTRAKAGAATPITSWFDFDRDGDVDGNDVFITRLNSGAALALLTV